MKNLNLLNKIFLSILLILSFSSITQANEPVDIWNIEKIQKKIESDEKKDDTEKSIESLITNKKKKQEILVENSILSSNIKLVGLYDPSEN